MSRLWNEEFVEEEMVVNILGVFGCWWRLFHDPSQVNIFHSFGDVMDVIHGFNVTINVQFGNLELVGYIYITVSTLSLLGVSVSVCVPHGVLEEM